MKYINSISTTFIVLFFLLTLVGCGSGSTELPDCDDPETKEEIGALAMELYADNNNKRYDEMKEVELRDIQASPTSDSDERRCQADAKYTIQSSHYDGEINKYAEGSYSVYWGEDGRMYFEVDYSLAPTH